MLNVTDVILDYQGIFRNTNLLESMKMTFHAVRKRQMLTGILKTFRTLRKPSTKKR